MDNSGDEADQDGIKAYLFLHNWWRDPVVGGKYETQKVLLGQSVRFKWLVHSPSRVNQAVQNKKYITRWEKHSVLISFQSVILFPFRLNDIQFVFVTVLQRGDVIQREGRDGHLLQARRHPDIRGLRTKT